VYKLLIILLIVFIPKAGSICNEIIWKKVDSVFIYREGGTTPYAYWFWAIDCANDSDCIAIGDIMLHIREQVTTDGGRT